MKRIRIIIILLVLLMLNGCGNEANVPFSGSNAPPDTAAMAQEKDPGSVTDVSSQIVIRESAEQTDSKEPEMKPSEIDVILDSKQPEDESAGSSVISSQPANDQSEEDVSESYVPEEDPPESLPSEEKSETEQAIESESEPEPESEPMSEPETEDESEQTSDPSTEEAEQETDSEPENETEAESEQEPITEPESAFDIEYWISYARDTATGLGLEFDSSAVDCWDNPITANPDCIYLERDITARLSRYAGDEDITAVWIWYENIGTNKYLIYIGYA